jgi:hypothetical protein
MVYQASYYDRWQRLTDAEVYAARAHNWHEAADRFNRSYASKARPCGWGTHLVG